MVVILKVVTDSETENICRICNI